jgi:hypothetical protein
MVSGIVPEGLKSGKGKDGAPIVGATTRWLLEN